MHYLLAYRFVFGSPKWHMNLLLGGLCLFVPIVGQMVLIGWLFEVIDFLHRRRQEEKLPWVEPAGEAAAAPLPPGAIQAESPAAPALATTAEGGYPDFDLNRLQPYLMRGVWPFLAQLLIGLPLGLLMAALWVGGMAAVSFAGANQAGPEVILPILVAVGLLWAIGVLLVSVVQTPIYIRAGLSGNFGAAFSFAAFKDFLRRVGLEVVLAQFVLTVTGTLLTVVGLLACYFGIFPAMALYVMAMHHLDYQLYELYLERGGQPVEPPQSALAADRMNGSL